MDDEGAKKKRWGEKCFIHRQERESTTPNKQDNSVEKNSLSNPADIDTGSQQQQQQNKQKEKREMLNKIDKKMRRLFVNL